MAADPTQTWMNPETLTALQGSIEKWQQIVDGTGVDRGPDNCPLCQRFRDGTGARITCYGCPVFEHTGKTGCNDTPYYAYEDAMLEGDLTEQEITKLAQAELDFLKSLLPKDVV